MVQIIRTGDQLVISTDNRSDDVNVFTTAFAKLEHLSRWEKCLALDNPKVKHHHELELILEVLDEQRQVARSISNPEVLIDILIKNGIEQKVPFRLKAQNHSTGEWHAALLYLSSDYGIYSLANDTVPPHSSKIAVVRTPTPSNAHLARHICHSVRVMRTRPIYA